MPAYPVCPAIYSHDSRVVFLLSTSMSASPVYPAINNRDSRANDVLLDDLVHLRLWLCRGGYNENLSGLEDLNLVEGSDIELVITYLAEDCLTR